ncbi:MAG: DNA repair protein RecO [Wenzhouxiangella sp.]
MSRYEASSCWILHRRPWRESSLLIESFSREHGRVGLLARGLRSQSSPWRGLGEPFSPLRIAWTRRGELGTLTDIEAVGARLPLSGRALWCGLYANELLLSLVGRDEPVPGLADAYSDLLPRLAGETSQGAALRRFEMAILQSLGVAPDLEREALSSEPIRPEGCYRLEPETGFLAAVPGRGVYSGRAILALSERVEPGLEERRQARDILRVLIDHQLDGRVLKTRELFRSMR